MLWATHAMASDTPNLNIKNNSHVCLFSPSEIILITNLSMFILNDIKHTIYGKFT